MMHMDMDMDMDMGLFSVAQLIHCMYASRYLSMKNIPDISRLFFSRTNVLTVCVDVKVARWCFLG